MPVAARAVPSRLLAATAVRLARSAIALIVALAVAVWAVPVAACGCGGYIPHDGTASVSRERALLTWDGRSEQLVISLDVLGTATEAALLLPVPARTDVKLGNARIWSDLQQLSAPLVRHEVGGGNDSGVGGPPVGGVPVTVLARQTLGPFDVTNLAASDADELVRWLSANGYQLSPGLARTLAPYVAEGWFYVAVRLQPNGGHTLGGTLDPLTLTFAASAPIYPMRASANAAATYPVTLYVLADHRVQKTESFGTSDVAFAGWIEPSDLGTGSALAPFVGRRVFLTEFGDTIEPHRVNSDFHFRFADSDSTYRGEVVVYDLEPPATDAWPTVLALAAMVSGVSWWRRRRRRS